LRGVKSYLKSLFSSKKPVFLVSNRQGSGESRLAVELTHKGLPVIDGINQFLTGTKKMFEYRDFQKLYKNRSKLKSIKSLSIGKSFDKKIDERDTYDLLKLYKIPMNEIDFVSSMKDLEKYVGKFPLVMKTGFLDNFLPLSRYGIYDAYISLDGPRSCTTAPIAAD